MDNIKGVEIRIGRCNLTADMEGNSSHVKASLPCQSHKGQGLFPRRAKFLVKVHMGLGIINAQAQKHGRMGYPFGNFADFRFTVKGHTRYTSIDAGLEASFRLDGIGIDHLFPRNTKACQGTDFPVTCNVKISVFINHGLQDSQIRIGLHCVMDSHLRDMGPQDVIIFFNLFQGKHQQRSAVSFS